MLEKEKIPKQLMRICIGKSATTPGDTHPCTTEEFDAVSRSEYVENICKSLKSLPKSDETKDERKRLKAMLPVFCFNASSFEGNYRTNKNAVANHYCMIDWDNVDNIQEWLASFGSTLDEQKRELRMCGLIGLHLSASGNGFHGIIPMREGETIQQSQARVARYMNKPDFDQAAHALSQSSFVVPYYYWFFLDKEQLLCQKPTEVIEEVEAVEVVPAESSVFAQNATLLMPAEATAVVPTTAETILYKAPEGPVVEDAEILSEETIEEQQDAYDGVPMKLIVNAIIYDLMKLTANPVEGTRNNRYLELQRHLRYFCNFDVEKMLSAAPDWGLPEAERLTACKSAAKYDRVPGLPRALQELLTRLQGQLKLAEGYSLNSRDCEPLPTNLPKLLTLLLKLMPREYAEAVILASLPFLGTLTTALRYKHNELEVETTTFQFYLCGHMASGKGFVRHLNTLLMKPMDLEEELVNARERDWREECNAAGEGKKQRDPHNVIRRVEADFTIPALRNQLINARGQHLLLCTEESDTVRMSKELSSILRNAFDGVKTGQSRVSTRSVNGSALTHLNTLMCGTPAALKRMLSDPEDGLVSRMIFCTMSDRLGLDEPEYGHLTAKEYNDLFNEVNRLHHIGLIENLQNLPDYQPEHHEVWIKKLPRTEAFIKSWNAARKLEFYLSGCKNIALEKFSRRMGTQIRRIAMVAWALEGGKETNRSIELLRWAADRILNEMLDHYGYQYEKVYHETTASTTHYKRHSKNSDLLSLLPNPFTVDDIVRVQQNRGFACTRQNAYVIASRLKGYIDPTGVPNTWRKIEGVC